MSTKEPTFFASTTRHLARKLNQQVSRVRDVSGFPHDVLPSEQVDLQFLQHVGFPETADSIAYEPTQGLLAIATSDGCVKLVGRAGVEATLRSCWPSPTKYLGFLRHRGALLRVTRDGHAQLFSVPGRRLLASVAVNDTDAADADTDGSEDCVNAVAAVPGGPYVLLGCESGDCRVVLIASRTGTSGGGVDSGLDPAADLALQPYRILGEDFEARGGVVAIAVARNGDRPLALIVHKKSGAVVWDVRGERVVAAAPDDEDDPSKPTAACWIGGRANCFAVGYDDGSVLAWGVPGDALRSLSAPKPAGAADCVLLRAMRVAPDNVIAAPVRSLTYIPGSPGTPGGEDCLLVCGGQPGQDPDMLTLLPLDPAGAIEARTVPWFGTILAHALMPRGADGATADGDASALMVLTEGGQLVVHDLEEWHPTPLTLPQQELPPITASRFLPSLSADQAAALAAEGPGGAGVQHAITLPAVYEAYRAAAGRSGSGKCTADWPFSGGEPAPSNPDAVAAGCHPSAMLLTGHRDGRVRIWDATAQVPSLIATVPTSAAARQERLRAVASLDVCPASGLLAVGHCGGDVRLYQFCTKPQSVRRVTLDESLVPYDTLLAQPPGFQYIMRYGAHTADAGALCLASRVRLLAVGDAGGCVSVVDLTAPQRLFQATPVPGQAVSKLAVGPATAGAADDASATAPASPTTDDLFLFVASEDSSLTMVALHSGQPVARTLRPKNASRPLDMALLDAQGVPLLAPAGGAALPWADNNAAAPARSLHMMKLNSHNRTDSAARRDPATAAAAAAGLGGGSGTATPSSARRRPSASLEIRALDSEPDDEDEADLDAALAAAAAEADAGGSAKSRSRFSIFRRRSPSPDKRAATGRASRANSFAGEATTPLSAASPSPRLPTFTPPAASAGTSLQPSPRPEESVYSSHGVFGSQQLTGEAPPTAGSVSQPPARTPEEHASSESEDEYGIKIDTTTDLWGRKIDADTPLGATPKSRPSSGAGPAPAIDYPYVETGLEGGPLPLAHYVLVATADYLRVYAMGSVRLGDRVTDRKARLGPPGAVFAGVFLSEWGPGVASVSADGRVAVHSVPGLVPLMPPTPLDGPQALGFPWRMPDGEAACAGAAWAASLEGQLLLTAPGNEIARLAVVRDTPLPLGAASTFDWDAARAGKAAAVAAAKAAPRAASLEPTDPEAERQAAQQGFAAVVRGAAGAMMSELDRVRLGVLPPRDLPTLRALFETPVGSLAVEDNIDFLPGGESSAAGGRTGDLYGSSGRDDDSGGEGGNKVVAAGAAAAVAAVAVAGKAKDKAKDLASAALHGAANSGAKLKSMLPIGRRNSDDYDPVAAAAARDAAARDRRNELLGTPGPAASGGSVATPGGVSYTSRASASPYRSVGSARGGGGGGGGRYVRRSTSEIKRHYGHTRAQDARATMERNKMMLAERGEKLKNLEEKAAAMAGDAEDFSSLAAELEAAFSNRKWWQF